MIINVLQQYQFNSQWESVGVPPDFHMNMIDPEERLALESIFWEPLIGIPSSFLGWTIQRFVLQSRS